MKTELTLKDIKIPLMIWILLVDFLLIVTSCWLLPRLPEGSVRFVVSFSILFMAVIGSYLILKLMGVKWE